MPTRRRLGCAVVLAALATGPIVAASDLGHAPKLRVTIHPKKASSTRDRASEVVQRSPLLALADLDNKNTPSRAGHIFIVEKSEGNRWLISDMNEGLRGWVPPQSVVPLADADAYFTQQLKIDPRSAFAFLMRGVARCENDDLDRGAVDLDESLRVDATYVPALTARAYLWQLRGRLDLALADASRALELEPGNSYAFVERGVFEFAKNDFDKALDDIQSALDHGSNSAVIHIVRGLIFFNRQDPHKALGELKMAILADPRHPDAYAALASIFMAEGKFAKALKVLDQAVKVDPLSADSHGNRAVLYLAMRQYARALDDLDEVLRVAPNSSRALRERAWILATCADPKIRDGGLAVTAAAKACELTGWQDISSIGTLAAACAEAGDLAGAVKWQKRVMELLPQQSPEFDDQKRLLDRYLARKPYRRLTLLEERGLSESRAEEKQAQ